MSSMPKFEPYHQQHQEILSLVTDVHGLLHRPSITDEAEKVLSLVGRLAEKLRIHLAQEDQVLYPDLLRHPDRAVREIAKRYMASMGDLHRVFQGYRDRWDSAEKLCREPDVFIKETGSVFEALAKRMLSEETELYPLTRKAGG